MWWEEPLAENVRFGECQEERTGLGGWDVWVRPPRRAASQPGSRDRCGGEAAQWPQFERSPIQIGGGGDTGEENSGGGSCREEKFAANIFRFREKPVSSLSWQKISRKLWQSCKHPNVLKMCFDERMMGAHPDEMEVRLTKI